ncbi:MAG: alanine racemase [Tenuifilaceae bacterium]
MNTNYPYLLLDKERCLENIKRMSLKAANNNLMFRPHFKTHQSIEIGNLYKQVGVTAITVSSFSMAEYFALGGWNDITVAFPASPFDADKINRLASKIQINILFSSFSNLRSLDNKISHKIGVFIELNIGYDRSGISPDNLREIAAMVNHIEMNNNYQFNGFLTHTGQTYNLKTKEEVETIHRKTLTILTQVKSFWKESYPEIIISYGDTPSCSVSNDFWGIDEIRPGNFVFYDLMQSTIGSCTLDQIAVSLICPVVDVYPERGEAIIHGGAVHLSKDFITLPDNNKSFGLPCNFDGSKCRQPYDGLFLKSISQEHGIIGSKEIDQIAQLKPGQLVAILPVHSCLTVDTMGELYLSDGSSISTMRKRIE